MAPEVLKNETYTEKCDCYSFGVVLCELFSREELYKDMTVLQIRFMVRTQSLRPHMPNFFPLDLKKLIEQCWSVSPEERPSFQKILKALSSAASGKESKVEVVSLEDSKGSGKRTPIIPVKSLSRIRSSSLGEKEHILKADSL
jgi:hypothetical protein